MRAWWKSIVVGVGVSFLFAALVFADTTSIQLRQLNTLWRDGATVDAPTYGMLVSGWDGTNPQFLSATTAGFLSVDTEFPAAAAAADDFTNPTTPNAMAMLMGWDSATWDRIRSFAGNADNVTNPTLGLLGAVGFTFGYDRLSGNWDRVSVGLVGDAIAAADTEGGWGSTSIGYGWNGTAFDRLDSVDTGARVTEICDSGTGDTLCADVETAGADNLANTENGLVTYSNL